MKQIEITFPNGETWRIPAQVVAADRAEYYSDLDFQRGHTDDKEAAYETELHYALNDEAELVDYLRNNMDWQQVQAHAVKVERVTEFDYAEGFDSAKFEVKAGES